MPNSAPSPTNIHQVQVQDSGSDVIFLSDYEDPTWDFACVHPSPGSAPCYVFFCKPAGAPKGCFVKVQAHNQEMLVKCITSRSSHYCGLCCKAVQYVWNDVLQATSKVASLRSSRQPRKRKHSTNMYTDVEMCLPLPVPDRILCTEWTQRGDSEYQLPLYTYIYIY